MDEHFPHQVGEGQEDVGQVAWNWVVRQFESEVGLDQAAHDAFLRWLGEDSRHSRAYRAAIEIWTAAGCLGDEDEDLNPDA